MFDRSKFAIPALLAMTIACSDAPTEPAALPAPGFTPHFVVAHDPTLVTYNSASCTLADASTGVVDCSWNISNPGALAVNMFAEALVDVTYNCINPKSGKAALQPVQQILTYRLYENLSSTTISGTDQALPAPYLQTGLKSSMKKLNACNGNSYPEIVSTSLAYWDVYVESLVGELRWSCFGSDNRNQCFTN